MIEPAIVTHNLSKNFGDFCAVKNLNLSVATGKIFAFLGTNGAGKTTTIRMLCGITRPTSGEILLGGVDLGKHPEKAKSLLGVIPDRPHLYGRLSGREFVRFMADLYNYDRRQANKNMEELFDTYQLAAWADELIEGYSHGMRQRLMLIAAQVHDPEILIVDEPVVGLDPPGARLLKETLKRRARSGKTVFMSTHSLGVAEELADEIAIIKEGIIKAHGTLDELRIHGTSGQASNLEELFLEIIDAELGEGVVSGSDGPNLRTL
ncbi:MAG: ABC transporter ATP-binding protein [bacterium]|nr:ABC transporter ATP-binding protein [bacterium]